MKSRKLSVYLYFLPIFIFIFSINIYPLFKAIGMSTFSYNLLQPGKNAFVGLSNFKRLLFDEPLFWKSFMNGGVFTLTSVFFEYLIGLTAALILNSQYIRMKNIIKAVLMLPWAVPIAINSLNWSFLLSPNYGAVNQLLSLSGFEKLLTMNWLNNLEMVMGTVIFINVWRSFPFYTITIAAGLASIPKELYEAARVDGTGTLQRFWHVTLPGIRSTSSVIIIFHLIWTFINFDVIYLLTGGGPLNETEVLPTLLYRQAFTYFDMGYASSIGVFIALILVVFIGPLYSRNISND